MPRTNSYWSMHAVIKISDDASLGKGNTVTYILFILLGSWELIVSSELKMELVLAIH